MADEPKLMTEAELDEVADGVVYEDAARDRYLLSGEAIIRLIHQARQSLGLQERAEKAEAEVAELRAERNEYFRRLIAIGELRR